MSNKIALLQDAANRLRVSALEQVAKANSGHSTSSISAAEIVATLFFDEMRYDVQHPKHPSADRFILSKVFFFFFLIKIEKLFFFFNLLKLIKKNI